MGTEIQTMQFADIADMLDKIKAIQSVDEILSYIKKIDALKVALEAAEVFHQQSVQYAKLEANSLIRVAELGGIKYLRGYHRKTANWLFGLSEQERLKYIAMCEGGVTIDNIYKREIEEVRLFNEQTKEIERLRSEVIQECKHCGIVDITPFINGVRSTFKYEKRSIGEDIIDGTRNRLRQAGAVGIGDGSGIYVMPKPDNNEEVKKAIRLRYESICNDFRSIKEIARAGQVKMSYKDFDDGANFSYHNNRYIVNILLALIDIGIISDRNDCISAIDKTNFYEEISDITKQLRLSREQYIKLQYEKYFGKE